MEGQVPTKAPRHKGRKGGCVPPTFLSLGLVVTVVLSLAGCGSPGATATPEARISPPPQAATSLPTATAQSPASAETVGPAVLATTTDQVSATAVMPSPAASTTSAPATAEATASATTTATPTLQPPSPSPFASPLPPDPSATPGGAGAPQVLSFSVSPTVTENVGDVVSISWLATGDRAELCPLRHGPVTARCREVPLESSAEFVTDEESTSYAGFGLKVSTGEQVAWGTQLVHFQCQNLRSWFFPDPPPVCPAEEAAESYAAGQSFERGLMLWIEDTDLFYVFYAGEDEYGRQTFDQVPAQNVKPGASEAERVGEEPPPGLYEPVSGFGLVWRGEVEGIDPRVRERLGWATAPEVGFTTRRQCQTQVVAGAWTCYLAGPGGEVIRHGAVTTAGYPLVWDYD